MKYCLHSRLTDEYLQKANEIKVEYRDRKTIPDLIEKYPKAIIILEEDLAGEQFDWKEIDLWNKLAQGRLIICLAAIYNAEQCKKYNVKFYVGYPVKTLYELNGLKNLGVCYVRLDAPLFFRMNVVKAAGVPIRLIPNLAYGDGLPREDGVCGTWVRPEDIDIYDAYVDVVEFTDCDINKEQALYRIYAEQKVWPGELGMIITNLNYSASNRMILPEVAEKRLNCGHKCQENERCKICYRALSLANRDLIKDYVDTSNQF